MHGKIILHILILQVEFNYGLFQELVHIQLMHMELLVEMVLQEQVVVPVLE